jgi:drug/metabolite transporter (DMT)-like permease
LNPAAVAVGLAAAVTFGLATALMHHAASRAPRNAAGIVTLLRHLLVQPRWLVGMVASLVGLALHTLALRLGSLAVIQPLVVTSLVFAFIFRALLAGRRLSRELMAWVLLTAAGITLFLLGARSTSGSVRPSGPAAAVVLVVGAAVAIVAWRLSRRVAPHRAGLLLGISGGVVFGLIAGVLKAATGATSLGAALQSWPVYVLAGLGLTGFLLNQRAYSSAPLASSLPVLNVVNPVVAVLFGVLVFHERPSSDPSKILMELIGLLLVLAGVSSLARVADTGAEDDEQLPPPRIPRSRRAPRRLSGSAP